MYNSRLRKHLVKWHRWVGLALAPFLLLVALTGSILAYYHELDVALNPKLYPQGSVTAVPRPTELLGKAKRFAASYGGEINHMPLKTAHGSVMFRVKNSAEFDQLFLEPTSGHVLGHRRWGDLSQGLHNTMGFIYKLHYRLALSGKAGVWILGIAALLWTIDCIVALMISSPKSGSKKKQRKSRWNLWKRILFFPAKLKGLAFHFNLHRALGVWTWLLLLMFAWSGVAFNLPVAYNPVTSHLFDYQPYSEGFKQSTVKVETRLDFDAALALARQSRSDLERDYAIEITHEDSLNYLAKLDMYRYRVNSDRDLNETLARTQIFYDASSGQILKVDLPSGQRSGNTITRWLYALHMGQVFGAPYKALIFVMGLLTGYLVYSGVLLWIRRRR